MKRLYIFIFLVGLLGNNIMYAQIPASSQSLPSPNVAALGLYGEIPVSKFTGMPDISVPIYEVPVGDFKLPFSLHYHAAGMGRNGVEFKYRRSCIQNGEGQA